MSMEENILFLIFAHKMVHVHCQMKYVFTIYRFIQKFNLNAPAQKKKKKKKKNAHKICQFWYQWVKEAPKLTSNNNNNNNNNNSYNKVSGRKNKPC